MRTLVAITLSLLISLSVAEGQQNSSYVFVDQHCNEPPAKTDESRRVIDSNHWIQLNYPLTVLVTGLKKWQGENSGNTLGNLRLYLAGRMLPNATPLSVVPIVCMIDSSFRSMDYSYVTFDFRFLTTDAADRLLMVEILSEARRANQNLVPITLGAKDDKQPFDSASFVTVQVYPSYTPLVIVLLIVLAFLLVLLGAKTPLLRDNSNSAAPLNAPYSLGRVQMAWWFFIVIAGFLYVWLITGEYNALTSSVLALIGISSGTGLASVFVDREKLVDANNQRAGLESQQTALKVRIAEISSTPPGDGSTLEKELLTKKDTLAKVEADLTTLPPTPAASVSKGFLNDLLRDGSGISFPRFQITIWTVVLAIIFIRKVYADLVMPDFDPTLLGLMGISSGTYLGFKFPEKPK